MLAVKSALLIEKAPAMGVSEIGICLFGLGRAELFFPS